MADKISYVTECDLSVVKTQRALRACGTFSVPFFLGAIATLFFACSHAPPSSGKIPTTLVLGLDGISYETFKKFQDGGHLRNFQNVSPMVASFPSTSDPNWSRLFGLPPEEGFTKAFYDPTIQTPQGMGGENGSIISHLSRQPQYERVMDFRLEGMWEHISMFVWLKTTALYWLESLEKQFFDFRGRDTYFALIINTDLISHTEGEAAIYEYLAALEKRIDEIQSRYKKRYGGDLEVILVSDHGNAFLSAQDIPWETGLADQKWRVVRTISEPHDVAFYVPEMLGFGAFYCKMESKRDLTSSLVHISHIQSAMYEDKTGKIHVMSEGGKNETLISYDEGHQTYDYKILKGKDPYDQARYFKKGPLKAKDYFDLSYNDFYPYAVVRVWEGFNKNSKIKPFVLANAEFGFVFGNKALRLITNLKGFSSSHGSLARTETQGIFVSTSRSFPPIRPEDFRNFVNVSGLAH